MRKNLYLAVMRKGMSFYAQHALPMLLSEAEFLALPEVVQVLKSAQMFGDKVRLMEDDPNPKNPNIFIRDLI